MPTTKSSYDLLALVHVRLFYFKMLTVKEWLNAKSETFSRLCQEDFTRKEVILAHLGAVVLVLVCMLASWIEGGAS